jgi:outer membrane protein TolC
MTLATWLAKKKVKTQWQSQGLRLQRIEASEIAKAARAYLDEHRELIDQARATWRPGVGGSIGYTLTQQSGETPAPPQIDR